MLYCDDNNDCDLDWICCRECEKVHECKRVCTNVKDDLCENRTDKKPRLD